MGLVKDSKALFKGGYCHEFCNRRKRWSPPTPPKKGNVYPGTGCGSVDRKSLRGNIRGKGRILAKPTVLRYLLKAEPSG